MNATELRRHVFGTYLDLRYGMAALAIAFPVVLFLVGWAYGIGLEDSMSAYYFSLSPGDQTQRVFPVRTWFVGILFALGAFLYLYKGFSERENYLLNCAGVCAWAVALIPTPSGQSNLAEKLTAHGTAAVLLFLSVAAVCLLCAGETLHLITDEVVQAKFRRQYKVLGVAMIVSPLVAWILTVNQTGKYTFAIETVGAWAFGLYWWRKSEELSRTGAETLANRTELELP